MNPQSGIQNPEFRIQKPGFDAASGSVPPFWILDTES
jgi:hypothetical protein